LPNLSSEYPHSLTVSWIRGKFDQRVDFSLVPAAGFLETPAAGFLLHLFFSSLEALIIFLFFCGFPHGYFFVISLFCLFPQ
jgi:hypothetical protein